jgi:S-adenosylmethionine synthetase
MVSRIGDPITEPKMVHVEIIPYKKGADEGTVESIVKETVSNIPLLWKDIIERKIRLF